PFGRRTPPPAAGCLLHAHCTFHRGVIRASVGDHSGFLWGERPGSSRLDCVRIEPATVRRYSMGEWVAVDPGHIVTGFDSEGRWRELHSLDDHRVRRWAGARSHGALGTDA